MVKRTAKRISRRVRSIENDTTRNNFRDLISIVSDQAPGASAFSLELGKFSAFTSVQDVRPGAQITWYYYGPAGARVNVSISRIQNTGGHIHPGGPAGSVSPTSFTLGPNYPQNVPVVFTAPIAAGSIQQLGHFSNGQTVTVTNRVHIPGLIALTGGVGITLTGSTPTHPQNHYGTSLLVTKIQQLAAAFHAHFGKNIFVNDMSLPDGGLYDFRNSWAPPHSTHREGRTVDINSTSMSPDEKTFFRQTAGSLGFSVTLETNPEHWHLFI